MLGIESGKLVQILASLVPACAPYTVLKGEVYIHPILAEGLFRLIKRSQDGGLTERDGTDTDMTGKEVHMASTIISDIRRVRGLGEVALRVEHLDNMQKFYEEVIGLELMKRFPTTAFFRIAEGYGGHTQVLALFDRRGSAGYCGISADKTTMDHLAFEIDLANYEHEKRRLEQTGLKVITAEHAWIHWRSLYVNDPEGNTVEFVCYDEQI